MLSIPSMPSMPFKKRGPARAWPGALALLALALILAACNNSSNSNAPAIPASVTHLPHMTVVVKDSALTAPASVPAGLLLVTLQNQGSQPHEAQFARLNNGVSAAQVVAAIKQQGTRGALKLVTLAGGVDTLAPGQQQQVVVNLIRGNYLVLSLTPDAQGNPQVDDKLYQPFSVTPPKGQIASSIPPSSGVVTLKDYTISLPGALYKARLNILEVINNGPQPHELALFKAAKGKTIHDVLQYLQGHQAGPPPYTAVGGIAGLAPQTSGWVLLHLAPGNYLAVCLLPAPVAGTNNLDMGMQIAFNVA